VAPSLLRTTLWMFQRTHDMCEVVAGHHARAIRALPTGEVQYTGTCEVVAWHGAYRTPRPSAHCLSPCQVEWAVLVLATTRGSDSDELKLGHTRRASAARRSDVGPPTGDPIGVQSNPLQAPRVSPRLEYPSPCPIRPWHSRCQGRAGALPHQPLPHRWAHRPAA